MTTILPMHDDDDPLAAARGIVLGLAISLVIDALILLAGFWLWFA